MCCWSNNALACIERTMHLFCCPCLATTIKVSSLKWKARVGPHCFPAAYGRCTNNIWWYKTKLTWTLQLKMGNNKLKQTWTKVTNKQTITMNKNNKTFFRLFQLLWQYIKKYPKWGWTYPSCTHTPSSGVTSDSSTYKV